MKLDETTIDDEKENTCNGNGIHEKPVVKALPAPESSNGDVHNDSGSSDSPGVGDLLVVDTNTKRHENEDHGYQNGNRADDSTSVSSSSSNFPVTEQDDLSEEEEITLRLSDDEDLAGTTSNESDNKYYTSSPCPKADDDENKNEENTTPPVEDNSKSEQSAIINEKIVNNDNNPSDSEINSEKDSSVEKSDDNLDNLISDLNEQSKSALKTESEKVTVSDLRKEIEDFIKNHDNEQENESDVDKENSENITESVPESTETENDHENKENVIIKVENNYHEISEKEDKDNEISENLLTEMVFKDEIIKEEEEKLQINDLKSLKMEVDHFSEIKNENNSENITDNISKNTSENSSEKVSKNASEMISEKASEIISENSSENIPEKASENVSDDISENVSDDILEDISENSSESSENITDNSSKKILENDSEIISETAKENHEENKAAESDKDGTENEPTDKTEAESENKQTETINSIETMAENPSELIKTSETNEIDQTCQKINDDSEIVEPDTTEKQETDINNIETRENDTPEITSVESITEEKQNTKNISDKEENSENISDQKENTKTISDKAENTEIISDKEENTDKEKNSENKVGGTELMETDSNEAETKIHDKEDAILIDDDVEMREVFNNENDTKEDGETSEKEVGKTNDKEEGKTNDKEEGKINDKEEGKINDKEESKTYDEDEKSVEENDPFDLLKEDKRDDFDKVKEDYREVFDLLKEDDTKQSKLKPEASSKQDDLKGKNHDRPGESKTSLKRSLENDDDQQDVKKPKINGIKKPKDPEKKCFKLDVFRDFMSKKSISSLTRAELEQLCLQKMCEAVTQTSKVGELNRKIMKQETMLETLRTKNTNLAKQVRDLEVVHSRVLQEVRTKCKESNVEITPVKITRSVGLQVTLQAIAGRVRTIAPQPEQPAVVGPTGGVKRKLPQRASLPAKLPPSSPPSTMPPPAKPPVRSPNQGKGIKTILPKVYPSVEPKDQNPSLLENYLQTSPSTSKTMPPVRKSAPGGGASPASIAPATSTSSPKVIDLTDEDDIQKTTITPTTTAIRVVSSQQLTTTTPVATGSLPRLTYLVQGSQQGQQLLLATSPTPNRPGQVRSTLMFKPVAPGQVQTGQRLNIVRQNVPGIAVIPTSSASAVRPGQQIRFTTPTQTRTQVRAVTPARHPAPLPGPPAVQPSQPNWKAMPPKPTLKISRVGDGIVLSWRMQNNKDMSLYEDIGSYQLYAYQETNGPPSTDMWRKVGDVKALALPMACTLTQFTDGNKYHFAVRAVDVKSRVGPFSQPEQIALP